MASTQAHRWHALQSVVANRWLGLALAGLTAVAVAMSLLEMSLGLQPGLNMAFAIGLLALLTWSAFGLRAAVGEPVLGRMRRLLELADVRGAIAGVDVESGAHHAPALGELAPGAHAHMVFVDPHTHVALPMPDDVCDAVVFGPRVASLDEASRETLLDDAHRVLKEGGHLLLVLPGAERRTWLRVTPVEWMPGVPSGWWADALAERFDSVHHAPLSGSLDAVLARKGPGPLSTDQGPGPVPADEREVTGE